MSDYNELLDILKHLLLNRFAPKPSYTRGLLGDGQGNVQVPGRPDKSYVRFNRGSSEYFEVFNRTVNPVNDWPVLIGELPWQSGLTQVVDTDWAAFEQSGWGDNIGDTSPHAPTHEWPDGSPGSDPVNIHLRSIVPLRAYSLTGTTVYVNSLEYEYQGSGHVWGGLPGVDLSPVISDTTTGTMRYAGVYLDPASNALEIVTGSTTVHSSALTPPLVQFPESVIPAGRIKIYGSQGNISEADIVDARRPFDPIASATPTGDAGGDLTGSYPNPTVAGLYGYSLLDNAPSEGDVLMFSGSAWRPTTLPAFSREVGEITMWATDTAPDEWLLCYGQAVSRTTYSDLFAVVGTTFGVGDGSTTFNLPDFRGRAPIGQDDMGGSSADRVTDASADSIGGSGGAESHTLTESEMPAHAHTQRALNTASGTETWSPRDLTSTGYTSTGNTAPTGGGQPHDNMPPWMAINFIIYAGV